MPFDLDLIDEDWRAELSPEQLEALERRRRDMEPAQRVSERAPVRLVGADRPRLARGGHVG